MKSRQRIVMLVDCQSFYASVEKAEHPEYINRPLVVAGDLERRSGVVLASCPIAKANGVKTEDMSPNSSPKSEIQIDNHKKKRKKPLLRKGSL